MNLQVKFSLIFLLVFGVQLGLAGYVCDGFLQSSARDQVLRQARLMMESSLAARTYTDQQIKPLVDRQKTKRELAVYIGPMAKFIVDSTASEVHTVKDFYDALCREIPSSQDRERFLSRCKAGI